MLPPPFFVTAILSELQLTDRMIRPFFYLNVKFGTKRRFGTGEKKQFVDSRKEPDKQPKKAGDQPAFVIN